MAAVSVLKEISDQIKNYQLSPVITSTLSRQRLLKFKPEQNTCKADGQKIGNRFCHVKQRTSDLQ